jgi:alpha-ribazole phosphatase/probable phosphoglycerate mutase
MTATYPWQGLPSVTAVVVTILFETHSISEDNERGVASGWHHSRLSARGRDLAVELGRRRSNDAIAAVFCSDLRRAVETINVAFAGVDLPTFLDWRLRECDYGALNGGTAMTRAQERARFVDLPYPGGESWREAASRVWSSMEDIVRRHDGERILVIGHMATRYALDHYVNDAALETVVADAVVWQAGWEYVVDAQVLARASARSSSR